MKRYKVFLKSGAHFEVEADFWSVAEFEFQKEDTEDPSMKRVACDALGFFDEDGNDKTENAYIPFSEVAAIIVIPVKKAKT